MVLDWWELVPRVILGTILGLIDGGILGYGLFLVTGGKYRAMGWYMALAGVIIGALAGPLDREWRFARILGSAFEDWGSMYLRRVRAMISLLHLAIAILIALPEALLVIMARVLRLFICR